MSNASRDTGGLAGLTHARQAYPVSDTVTEKRKARSVLAARRRQLAAVRVRQLSLRVCARLLTLPEIVAARAVCMYAALPGEVDLTTLFEACRAREQGVLLPRFNAATGVYEMVAVHDLATETAPGNLGVREPLPRLPVGTERQRKAKTTAWLVPGLGFDRVGRRLGRGKGFYDRLLSGTQGPRIGVAFSWQLLPEIPAEAHDVRMNAVVTETGVFRKVKGKV